MPRCVRATTSSLVAGGLCLLVACDPDGANASGAEQPAPTSATTPSDPPASAPAQDPTKPSAELAAELAEHESIIPSTEFEPVPETDCAEGYQVQDLGEYGKFYIQPQTGDLIKRELLAGKIWEPHVHALLERYVKPGSTVVDVGSHIGTHLVSIARLVGPEGTVVGFEPQAQMFKELRCNIQLNGITNASPQRAGAGDRYGELELRKVDPTNEGGVAAGKGGDKAPLRPLDGYTFENLSVLKIDVEGFEDQVLDGARNTIATHKPVVFIEIQGGKDWDSAPPEVREKIANTANKLTAFGYRVDRIGVFDYIALPKGSPPPPRPTPENTPIMAKPEPAPTPPTE